MLKYKIDYQHGIAYFFTEEVEQTKVLAEFKRCASNCFGIRKSLGNLSILSVATEDMPLRYRQTKGTHLLIHNRDEILFNNNVVNADGNWLKIKSEFD